MRGLEAIHLQSLRAHGVTLTDERIRELLALDLELNAQGIAIWLDRSADDEPASASTSPARSSSSPAPRNGIGAACARLFAASGAAVALWDVDAAAAQIAGRRARRRGARAQCFACDVARSAEVDAALAATVAAFGRVDVLVNNAGIFRAADFLDVTEADWDAVIDVNLKGAFLVGQAVAREMARRGGGAIVNMSSVNGVTAIPSIASYNASKGGIDQLTRVMALALADRGIRVNAVAPGTIATELAQKAVLGSAEASGADHEPHAAAAARRARRDRRRLRLPRQRRGELHDRRDRLRRRRPARAQLHDAAAAGRALSGVTAGAAASARRQPRLADRQVDQRRADGEHDVGVPHPVVAAGPLERLAAEPGAEEAADLVRRA